MPISNPTPPVSTRYGAPMGRHTGPDYLDAAAGRIYLRRVPINSDGYDRGGVYWGIGAPLWYAEDGDGDSRYFRSRNRETAKAEILADYPDARFFR